MQTSQNNLPPVFLSPGEKLVVYETRNFWGRKTTTYRVVADNGRGSCVVWLVVFVIALIIGAAVIYQYKPIDNGKNNQVNPLHRTG